MALINIDKFQIEIDNDLLLIAIDYYRSLSIVIDFVNR